MNLAKKVHFVAFVTSGPDRLAGLKRIQLEKRHSDADNRL